MTKWFGFIATPNLGAGDREPGPRGITGAANNASINNVLNCVTISSTGDAVDLETLLLQQQKDEKGVHLHQRYCWWIPQSFCKQHLII